tara:strand:+ start:5956 stop:7194 length:1239 start_codon:yes stop_codon:yes gene_type:complete
MALPAAGQPISFKDINDELGNSSKATLDLKSASEDLGEAAAPYGMDELAGLGALTIVQRTIEDFYLYERDSDQEDILVIRGWADDELIECVEDTSTAATGNGISGLDSTGETYTSTLSSGASHINTLNVEAPGGFVNGRVVRVNGNQTIGDVNFSDEASLNGGGRIFRNNAESKIHEIAADGTISNTADYKPADLTLSLVSKDNNSVTVRATGDTRVTKTLRFFKDSTEVAVTNHTKGAVGNTDVTKDQTFSSLAADTSFAFKVRGENGSSASPGNDSNTLNITTDPDPIALSPTSLSANGGGTSLPFVAESGTLTVTYNVSPAGTLKVFVNNTSNCRFKQATTSGGLSSASFGSLSGTNYSGGDTLTLSSSQVFLQFEVTLTSGTSTSRTFTISDNTNSETIVFNVTNLGR